MFTIPESVFTFARNQCSAWAGIRIAGGELVGERFLALRWASDDELVITINSTERIERLEHPFSDMVVRYEGTPKFGS